MHLNTSINYYESFVICIPENCFLSKLLLIGRNQLEKFLDYDCLI